MTDHAMQSAGPRNNPTATVSWRDVYILGGLRGLSFAGDIMAETAILLFLAKHGYGAYAVMALLIAGTVPPALLAPVAGAVADRFDSRTVIVTVATLQALVCLAMALWTLPVVLIGLSVVLSAGLAFTHPVFAGLPKSMVGADNVPRAASISQTSAMAGMVAAPAIAGLLTAQFGVRIPLVLDAASFVIVVIGGLAIRTRMHQRNQARGAVPAGAVKDAAGQLQPAYRVWSDPFLRSVLVMTGAVVACVSMNNVLIVFYVLRTFGASQQDFGFIMSCWLVGLIIGGVLIRRVTRFSHELVLIGSFLCLALGILGTGLVPGVWWIVPFYVLGGIGNGAMATVLHILLNLRIPDSHRGRGFAALGAVSNTAPAVGYFLGGAILSVVSPRYAFLIAGVAALLAILTLARGLRSSADDLTVAKPTADAGTSADPAPELEPAADPV